MQTLMQPALAPTALPMLPPPHAESLLLSERLPAILAQMRSHPEAVEPTSASAPDPTGGAGRLDGLIPAPSANGLTVGPIKLNAYGGILALGGMAGGVVAVRHLRASHISTAGLGKVVAPAVVAGLVGARLYHVATDWERYKDNPGNIPKVWEGGMGIYGGVAAGLGTAAVLAHRARLPIAPLLDAAAIGLPVAQAIGRFGNYANQELYGAPTNRPWGLQVDPKKRPDQYRDRNSFHPTFAYEAGWNVALAGGLFGLSKVWKGRPAGILLPIYLAGYGVGRFAVEGLRIDESKEIGGLRTNQWTSLAVVGAGLVGTATMLARRA